METKTVELTGDLIDRARRISADYVVGVLQEALLGGASREGAAITLTRLVERGSVL